MYEKYIKRVIDMVLSFIGLIVLSPVLLLFLILIPIESKGSPLFSQIRYGKNGKLFKIYKFRSMRTDTPKEMPTHLLENPDQYITAIGRFIRKTSIDELPQLYNILIGDMAIIGPRPALPNQTDLLEEREKYGANGVRPGLTGWAQINGRDELPIDVKARYDGEYCESVSFGFDMKCFFMTIGKVLRSDGYSEGKR